MSGLPGVEAELIDGASRRVEPYWLGRIGYGEAWELQRRIFAEVVAGERGDTVLLCEHRDVITVGRNARNDGNLLLSRDELERRGYEVFDVDRGGDVTYHGPGQLVGYPIIALARWREDLGWYVRRLEELIIRTIAAWGIEGGRKEGMTGVWTNERKICAIGIRASRWVTMHGFALNVTTDLSRFDAIVPCGIAGYEVTSIERERGERPELREVALRAATLFDDVFGASEAPRRDGSQS